ncbi:hypothetical protein [Streptomyces synnematoformans]|uniref:Uncharacterized protein n=1 Tax=Streptomyces synnematoformans TaxID=415721 RepID=A0ABN2XP66_9ACTN
MRDRGGERAGTVRVAVVGGADDDELDALTGQLRQALLELEVDDVRPVRAAGAAPEGAKPGEAVAVGVLAVTLVPVVLRSVVRLVEVWLQNRPVRSVRLELDGRSLELGDASGAEKQRLIEAFLDAGPSAGQEPAGREAADRG